jgi:hypothetical protein
VTVSVGEIVYAFVDGLVGAKKQGWKYLLRVCATNRLYMLVCSDRFENDFPISRAECNKLTVDPSWLSVAGYRHFPDDTMRRMKAERVCIVSDDFIKALCDHIDACDSLTARQKRALLSGLKSRLK